MNSLIANFRSAIIGSAALAIVAGGAAFAQSSENRVATNTDWSVFVEDDPTECWVVSAPKETVNKKDGRVVAVRRSDILLFVTYRPGSNVDGEVSFTGGYPFANGSTVSVKVGESTFEFFTKDENAWPATSGDDKKIVTAMKRGTSAIVTGRSTRGTVTQDTFSLLGFTAAIEEAEKRCGS
ncbi:MULTISPECIES: invasion associated locus B family protein [Halocynthiibacter]|uniref:Invasion associated locus B family protein n=1 Tax=Halocynthiibacter halioticoli TaxID=2986804 RepID=A0AAE3LS72_9RHOB|nr:MULTISPECIES: invasion associated locus B family protein [Halocynthiibacter]MCV6823031.1 invasion associated locus B family protein [Halocynthiibacter halioticoli]MCW4056032.1 invasion associated locus B family protein [Halocynthiibacter sp. SDUM655004]